MNADPRRTLVDDMFAALDRLDADGILACLSSDAVVVDEVTRSFVRGLPAITEHTRALVAAVSSADSHVVDYTESVVGDAAFATCVLEQSYVLDGESTHIVAPTTFGFRIEGGAWKICVFHSVPIADAAE